MLTNRHRSGIFVLMGEYMTMYKQRESFSTRLEKSDEDTQQYFKELEQALLEYSGVKERISLRCVTFRYNKDVIAKIALGGKTLKLYLAMDMDEDILKEGKYHPRDLSKTKAYEQVPTMLPIKSELAVRKAKVAIQYLALRKIYKITTI